jgi:hypothetical protein
MADVGKWLADTAKEAVGVNDFKKAGDAFSRADKTSKKAGDGIVDKVKVLPSYTKDIAVGVGDAAVGAGKAIINVGSLLIPEAKAQGAANAVAKGVTKLFGKTPKKIETPFKGGIPGGRQFGPSSGGGKTAVLERPKTQTKTQEAAPKAETSVKTESSAKSESKAESKAKNESKGKNSGRTKAFTAGAALAGLAGVGKADGDKPWTPSAIV